VIPLADYLAERRLLIDRVLDANLPSLGTAPAVIHEAMRYAVLGGGKRIRPILALAAAEACGGDVDALLVPAAALELIHTYSLVHDDLPALDDDDLRRGRKTTHVVFGEAMAILTGDALLTEAFAWLARPMQVLDGIKQLRAVAEVASAIDSRGMIGGQVADIVATGTGEQSAELLDFIHRNKTGRLLTASVVLGGLLAGAGEEQVAALRRYGEAAGLAFQIVDDLLDTQEDAATLGKTAGKDLAQGKLTYPAVFGTQSAREKVDALLAEALRNAANIGGPVNYLPGIARFICERRS
jgi:geranylgeranyl diphosphate synthase type II